MFNRLSKAQQSKKCVRLKAMQNLSRTVSHRTEENGSYHTAFNESKQADFDIKNITLLHIPFIRI